MAAEGNDDESLASDDLAHSEPDVGDLVFKFRFGDPDRNMEEIQILVPAAIFLDRFADNQSGA